MWWRQNVVDLGPSWHQLNELVRCPLGGIIVVSISLSLFPLKSMEKIQEQIVGLNFLDQGIWQNKAGQTLGFHLPSLSIWSWNWLSCWGVEKKFWLSDSGVAGGGCNMWRRRMNLCGNRRVSDPQQSRGVTFNLQRKRGCQQYEPWKTVARVCELELPVLSKMNGRYMELSTPIAE